MGDAVFPYWLLSKSNHSGTIGITLYQQNMGQISDILVGSQQRAQFSPISDMIISAGFHIVSTLIVSISNSVSSKDIVNPIILPRPAQTNPTQSVKHSYYPVNTPLTEEELPLRVACNGWAD